jgi:hypothetical protein
MRKIVIDLASLVVDPALKCPMSLGVSGKAAFSFRISRSSLVGGQYFQSVITIPIFYCDPSNYHSYQIIIKSLSNYYQLYYFDLQSLIINPLIRLLSSTSLLVGKNKFVTAILEVSRQTWLPSMLGFLYWSSLAEFFCRMFYGGVIFRRT